MQHREKRNKITATAFTTGCAK